MVDIYKKNRNTVQLKIKQIEMETIQIKMQKLKLETIKMITAADILSRGRGHQIKGLAN